jgi:hypothetical protein
MSKRSGVHRIAFQRVNVQLIGGVTPSVAEIVGPHRSPAARVARQELREHLVEDRQFIRRSAGDAHRERTRVIVEVYRSTSSARESVRRIIPVRIKVVDGAKSRRSDDVAKRLPVGEPSEADVPQYGLDLRRLEPQARLPISIGRTRRQAYGEESCHAALHRHFGALT